MGKGGMINQEGISFQLEKGPAKSPEEVDDDGEEVANPVSFFGIFKYSDKYDVLLLLVGGLCAAGAGGLLVSFAIIFGNIYDDFDDPSKVEESGAKYARMFGYIGVAMLVAAFGQVACFSMHAERQASRLRSLFLAAVLKQDMTWFESQDTNALSSKVSESLVLVRDAIGEKLGILIMNFATFLVGYIIAFTKNWLLSLVTASISPLLMFSGYYMVKVFTEQSKKTLESYTVAGAVAEETFSLIRTVASYSLESKFIRKYSNALGLAEKAGVKRARGSGLGMALTMFFFYLSYSLTFWYGGVLLVQSSEDAVRRFPPPDNATNPFCQIGITVTKELSDALLCSNPENDEYVFQTEVDICACLACNCGCMRSTDCVKGGDVVLVFFCIIFGAFALGMAAPSISAAITAKSAATKIFAIIDRQPSIDGESDDRGKVLEHFEGLIKFENVSFKYPTRKDYVFRNLNLTIHPNQTTALCGGSGCGKSTISALVQRFYDVDSGRITLDGIDIRELNVKWLRRQIGLVSQEPMLLSATIRDNISYGCVEPPTEEAIIEACKAANCFDFIQSFPEGFDTYIGATGGSSSIGLSGGQKQRIAIARALVRDPRILILDEATSALDNESERIVQKSLDRLLSQRSRSTLCIAHRLTTIQNADQIVVVGDGGVLEAGSHTKLKSRNGPYKALLAASKMADQGKMGSVQRSESDDQAEFVDENDDDEKPKARKSRDQIVPVQEPITDSKDKLYSVPMRRIFEFSKPELWLYVPGLLASTVNGLTFPMFALLYSEISTAYFLPTEETIMDRVTLFALIFVGFSVVVFASYYFQFMFFGIIAEKMTTRIRLAMFRALLRQEVGFFEDPRNSIGTLSGKLASDCALVKAAIGDRLALVSANTATIIAGLAICFANGWKLTLVLVAMLPLLALAGAMEMLVVGGLTKESGQYIDSANQLLSESIRGIRTVSAFELREKVLTIYKGYLAHNKKSSLKQALTAGSVYGFSQAVSFAVYAIVFWYGSQLIADGEYTFKQVLIIFFGMAMTGMGIGNTAAMLPDVGRASVAVSSVFSILDRKSLCDPTNPDGLTTGSQEDEGGNVEFQDVTFKYPSRENLVLDHINLNIKRNTVVALCGMSGSGKSTGISLIERFYDPIFGRVMFEGVDTKEANVQWLRNQCAYIQQEPALFRGSIFENIACGVPNEEQVVLREELEDRVQQAAKDAGIHDFIIGLPDGYDTMIHGALALSGGQRQRVCIARALVREPKVLLCDEITSALDNHSEQLVQQTLQNLAQQKRCTIIIIAHRLSTIQQADEIILLHNGKIVEQGSHVMLMSKNGPYAKLYKAQT